MHINFENAVTEDRVTARPRIVKICRGMARAKVDAVDVPASVELRRVALKSWFEVAVDDYGVQVSFLVAPFIVHALSSKSH